MDEQRFSSETVGMTFQERAVFDNEIMKHKKDFIRAIERGEYRKTAEGLLFPYIGATLTGEFTIDGAHPQQNTLMLEGLTYLLETGLRAGIASTAWYVALYGGDYTPPVDGSLTAAAFPLAAGEITSATEGYAEVTRPAWQASAAANGVMNNYGSEATFTIATATVVTIRGAAILSANTKGSTVGRILSAKRFVTDEVRSNGSVFQLGYQVRLLPTE